MYNKSVTRETAVIMRRRLSAFAWEQEMDEKMRESSFDITGLIGAIGERKKEPTSCSRESKSRLMTKAGCRCMACTTPSDPSIPISLHPTLDAMSEGQRDTEKGGCLNILCKGETMISTMTQGQNSAAGI